MDLVLGQNNKKYIASFCLLIYLMFSFLSNAGATLCLGTSQSRHIGLHALSYDSCPDNKICNFMKSRQAFCDSQNKFDCENFYLSLNKIPSLNFSEIFHCAPSADFFHNNDFFQEKYNKTEWDIYANQRIPSRLKELKNIILII